MCFGRSHVAAHLGKVVDKVRAVEHRVIGPQSQRLLSGQTGVLTIDSAEPEDRQDVADQGSRGDVVVTFEWTRHVVHTLEEHTRSSRRMALERRGDHSGKGGSAFARDRSPVLLPCASIGSMKALDRAFSVGRKSSRPGVGESASPLRAATDGDGVEAANVMQSRNPQSVAVLWIERPAPDRRGRLRSAADRPTRSRTSRTTPRSSRSSPSSTSSCPDPPSPRRGRVAAPPLRQPESHRYPNSASLSRLRYAATRNRECAVSRSRAR